MSVAEKYDQAVALFQQGVRAEVVAEQLSIGRMTAYRMKRRAREEGKLDLVGRRGPQPGHGGGPRLELTPQQIVELKRMAEADCTRREMAARLGMDEDTLRKRLLDTPSAMAAINEGSSSLRFLLRAKQVAIALEDGHPAQATMLVWCGKVILGQSERVNVKVESEEQAAALLSRLFPDLTDEQRALLMGDDDKAGEAVH